MQGIVRTVLGDILPDRLGVTHAHEHTIILPGESSRLNPSLLLDSPEKTTAELLDFKACGGMSVVDAQPIGVERSPLLMRDVSRKSGVNIIACSGFHRPCFYPEGHFLETDSVERLAERIEREITNGMIDDATGEATDVKAGLIKFTSEYHYIPPFARKAAEAAAIAQHNTGAAILTHTEMGTCGLEQIALAGRYGVKPSRMILSHLDRNPDPYLHKEIASTGAYLVYDGIARTKYWPDSTIIALLLEMIDSGFGSQLMLAMDAATRTTWTHYGYGPGLTYLLTTFVPRLRQAGATQENVDLLLLANPAQALKMAFPESRGELLI